MDKYSIGDYDLDDIISDSSEERSKMTKSNTKPVLNKVRQSKMTEKQMISYVEKNDKIQGKISKEDFDKYPKLQKVIIKKLIGYATKTRGKFFEAISLIANYKIKNVFQKIVEKFLKYSFTENNIQYWGTPLKDSLINALAVDDYDNLLVIDKNSLLTRIFLVHGNAYNMIKLYPDKFLDTKTIMSLDSLECNYIDKDVIEKLFDLILSKKTEDDAKKIFKKIIKLVVDNKLDSITPDQKKIIIGLYEKYKLERKLNDEISHIDVILIENEKDLLTFTENMYNDYLAGKNNGIIFNKEHTSQYYRSYNSYNSRYRKATYYAKIPNKLIELANALAEQGITETIMKIFTLITNTRGRVVLNRDQYEDSFFSQVILQNKMDMFIKFSNKQTFINNLIYNQLYDKVVDIIEEDYSNIKYIGWINSIKNYKNHEIKRKFMENLKNKMDNVKASDININIKRTYVFLNLLSKYEDKQKYIDEFLNNKFRMNQDEFNIILNDSDGVALGEIFNMGKFKFPINKILKANASSMINCIPEFENKVLNAEVEDFIIDDIKNNPINDDHKLVISMIRKNKNLIDYYYNFDKLKENLNKKDKLSDIDIFMAYNIKHRFRDELEELDNYFSKRGISQYMINTFMNNH